MVEKNLPYPLHPMVSIGTMKKEVLRLLIKGENAHGISRKVGRARSTVVEHLNDLQKLGLTKKGEYLWGATKLGKDYIEGKLGGRFSKAGYERRGVGTTIEWLQDRAHNIKIKYLVTEKPRKEAWLNSWKANRKLKNNVFYTQKFGEIVTTYTGKSLIFQLPIMKFKSSEIAVAEAGRIGQALREKYELEIHGLKLGEKDINSQLITQHHAIQGDPYAVFLGKHGISYHGDYVDIDASNKKIPEIEFVDSQESHIHHERYVENVEDIILNDPPVQSQIFELASNNTKNINQLIIDKVETRKELREFAIALNRHIPAYEGMTEHTKKLGREIRLLRRDIIDSRASKKNVKKKLNEDQTLLGDFK